MSNDLDSVLGALADPTRRRVVEVLGSGPRRAGDLAGAVGVPATGLARHLHVLRAAGLVTVASVDTDARGRVYSLSAERLIAVQAWIDQVQAFWTEQLGSFKTHADRRAR